MIPSTRSRILVGVIVCLTLYKCSILVFREQDSITIVLHQHPFNAIEPEITIVDRSARGCDSPLLVYVTETTERYHVFFKLMFDRMGIRHTENYESNWTMCWGSHKFPKRRFPWQRMNRIVGTQSSCSKKGLCSAMWNTSRILDPENAVESAINNGVFATCFVLPQHANHLKEFDAARNNDTARKPSGGLLSISNIGKMDLQSPPQWIMKRDETSGGEGVAVASDISDITTVIEPCLSKKSKLYKSDYCKSMTNGIIQQFVPNPLLLKGRRFSLRLFVLLDSLLPMRAFVSYVGYALVTSETEAPETRNPGARALCPWITNLAMQKKHCLAYISPEAMSMEEYFEPGTVVSSDILLNTSANLWTLTGLLSYLKEARPDLDPVKLWSEIRFAFGSALLRSYPSGAWRRKYRIRTDQLLYGFDATVLDNGKVTLFEINCHPFMGGNMRMMHKARELLLEGMIRLTGDMMYHYPQDQSDQAEEIVESFCKRNGNCTRIGRVSMRDTELMLRNRGTYDIAVPSVETLPLYEKLLTSSEFNDDKMLAKFVVERISALDIGSGDIRLIDPTSESIAFLDKKYQYTCNK